MARSSFAGFCVTAFDDTATILTRSRGTLTRCKLRNICPVFLLNPNYYRDYDNGKSDIRCYFALPPFLRVIRDLSQSKSAMKCQGKGNHNSVRWGSYAMQIADVRRQRRTIIKA